jgi:hypothetical protein
MCVLISNLVHSVHEQEEFMLKVGLITQEWRTKSVAMSANISIYHKSVPTHLKHKS